MKTNIRQPKGPIVYL